MPKSKANDDSVSLNKYISDLGVCSRREADRLIEDGRVTLNGQATRPGNRVGPGDEVVVDGENLAAAKKKKKRSIYMVYNKPRGIVCTTDPKERNNISKQISHPERLFPIGRLDKESDGLIFLTNDGDIVNKILRAGNEHEKEYIVTVKQSITSSFLKQMSSGIVLGGVKTKACTTSRLSKYTFSITLTQGMNRQIRRMCESLGYEVMSLTRTRIMNVSVGKLKLGAWRLLNAMEMDGINKMVQHSSKTQEASKKNFHRPKKK